MSSRSGSWPRRRGHARALCDLLGGKRHRGGVAQGRRVRGLCWFREPLGVGGRGLGRGEACDGDERGWCAAVRWGGRRERGTTDGSCNEPREHRLGGAGAEMAHAHADSRGRNPADGGDDGPSRECGRVARCGSAEAGRWSRNGARSVRGLDPNARRARLAYRAQEEPALRLGEPRVPRNRGIEPRRERGRRAHPRRVRAARPGSGHGRVRDEQPGGSRERDRKHDELARQRDGRVPRGRHGWRRAGLA